ncbi:MAG: tyrosine transporter [Chlamydiae bacterium]|nr:tyrosine transporter [Chlamydiota bacterium]
MKTQFSKIFSGSLLVAGTAIGAGMLALPVATAECGFIPAVGLYVVCWLFMVLTGLLMLEVCLWLPKDSNMISMSYHVLGTKGKMISWVLYLFLFYCLTIAYMAGGGGFIASIFNGALSSRLSILLFTLIFAPLVYVGARAVDKANMLLMLGLGISYFAFVFLGYKNVQMEMLARKDFSVALFALPIVFTSFSYQGLIPSLTSYLHNHGNLVRKCIWIGTAIPLIIYIIWEALILGIVPLDGSQGLLIAKQQGQNAVFSLKEFVSSPWVYAIGQAFAFFALTTSFLGVTLGLLDFLSDGLKIAKVGVKKLGLCAAVFAPPLFVASSNPSVFLTALSYAGGIGCALLLGVMPILMVWTGRYKLGYGSKYAQIKGGKKLLVVLFVFVCIELVVECVAEIMG